MARSLKVLIAWLALWPLLGFGGGAPVPVDRVLDCMRANVPTSLRSEDVSLVSFDRSGAARKMRGALLARRDGGLIRAMLEIKEPPDLSGAAYLTREVQGGSQEIYMYLPALGKVRRVRAQNVDSSLLGTDLSFADLKQLANAFDGTAPILESSQSLDGRPADVLFAASRPDAGLRFDHVRAWVDRQSCVAVKVLFYKGGVAEREFRVPAGALAQSGPYWYASRATMTTMETSTHTDLKVTGLRGGENIAERVFDPSLFYLGTN